MTSLQRLIEIIFIIVSLLQSPGAGTPVQGPRVVAQDILDYLNTHGSECHVPEPHLTQLLRSVGAERTPAGFTLIQLCYRPYPAQQAGGQLEDSLGSYCVLEFDLIRQACGVGSAGAQPINIPGVGAVTAQDICGVVAPWVQNGQQFQPVTRSQYGQQCLRTCAEDRATADAATAVNSRCYNLFYGRLVLTALQAHSNNTKVAVSAVNQPKALFPSGSTNHSAVKPTSGQAQLSESAAPTSVAPPSTTGSADVTDSRNITVQSNETVDLRVENSSETSTNATAVSSDGMPAAGELQHPDQDAAKLASQSGDAAHAVQNPAGQPVQLASSVAGVQGQGPSGPAQSEGSAGQRPSAAAAAAPPTPPKPDIDGAMKPGVLLSEGSGPKLSGYSGDSLIATEGGSMLSDGGEDEAEAGDVKADSHSQDAAHADAANSVEQSKSGAENSNALGTAMKSSSVNPIAPAIEQPSDKPSSGAVQSSSSRAPADEMPAPPMDGASSAKVASSSSSSVKPPSAAGAWPVADKPQLSEDGESGIAAPSDDTDSKLPAAQEVIPDPGALDYEDSMVESVLRPRPAQSQQPIGAQDDDDVTFDEPQLYKAPSGAQRSDQLAGVSAFQPLQGQGGSQSNFFAYSLTLMVLVIVVYLVFHNKQKIMGLIIEGRSTAGRRRPHSSQYRKLDSNLEEAITSQQRQQVTSNIIY